MHEDKVNKEKRGFGAKWVEVVVEFHAAEQSFSLLDFLFEICVFLVFFEIPKLFLENGKPVGK